MNKFTSGPWKYSIRKIEGCSICKPNPGSIGNVYSKDGSAICTLYLDENLEGNTKLIASCPDLLKALKNLVNCNAFKVTGKCYQCETEAKQVIAKAERGVFYV